MIVEDHRHSTRTTSPPRLVSFLGTGAYKPVRYRFEDREAKETRWIALALAQLCQPSPAEVHLIVTPESQGRLAEVAADLQTAGLPAPAAIEVPSAGDPQALWRQFTQIKTALRTDGRPVVLDITHGFRSQPFFAAAVAAFVRAVDHEPPMLRILYGAFDAPREKGEPAPIWELTAFVELLDWTREIMLFLHTGRAAEVASRTETLDGALGRAWSAAGKHPKDRPSLDRLAKALAEFGGDLETIRTGSLLLGDGKRAGSAARLLEALAAARPAAAAVAPPLADVLDRIKTMATPLPVAAPTLAGPRGHEALVALARLYLDMARYTEAISVVREARITPYGRAAVSCPGLPVFDNQERERAEHRWWKAEQRRADDLAGVRNDIDHAGFRSDPKPPKTLIAAIDRLIGQLSEPPPPSAEGNDPAPWIFANLSNHPSADWSEAQRDAALAYADRIEDVPFPAVPPALGRNRFNGLVKETAARVPAATTHAMVQGEFTLCFALVRELQRRGIACFAAATDRDVDVAGGAKLSRFDFVRFREYPNLTGR
jgi:CRISPR-associated protein Csx16